MLRVLYCSVLLYCKVLCWLSSTIVLYCTVLYCIVMYCTVLYCTMVLYLGNRIRRAAGAGPPAGSKRAEQALRRGNSSKEKSSASTRVHHDAVPYCTSLPLQCLRCSVCIALCLSRTPGASCLLMKPSQWECTVLYCAPLLMAQTGAIELPGCLFLPSVCKFHAVAEAAKRRAQQARACIKDAVPDSA